MERKRKQYFCVSLRANRHIGLKEFKGFLADKGFIALDFKRPEWQCHDDAWQHYVGLVKGRSSGLANVSLYWPNDSRDNRSWIQFRGYKTFVEKLIKVFTAGSLGAEVMGKEEEREPGWLGSQFKKVEKEMKRWPKWMQREAGL